METGKDVLLNRHAILEILDDIAVEVKLQLLPQLVDRSIPHVYYYDDIHDNNIIYDLMFL